MPNVTPRATTFDTTGRNVYHAAVATATRYAWVVPMLRGTTELGPDCAKLRRVMMGIVLLDMGMSLDGFAATRDSRALYPIEAIRHTPVLDQIIARAGAVVMGRGAYDMGDPDGFVNYEYQVPIIVLTHRVPTTVANGENDRLRFTFVTDGLASALAQAKATAGDKNVSVIGGITVARDCIKAGLLDELQIRVLPTLLGAGQRLFENLGIAPTQLETLTVQEYAGITHLRYRIVT